MREALALPDPRVIKVNRTLSVCFDMDLLLPYGVGPMHSACGYEYWDKSDLHTILRVSHDTMVNVYYTEKGSMLTVIQPEKGFRLYI
jgi:hypothetical protein